MTEPALLPRPLRRLRPTLALFAALLAGPATAVTPDQLLRAIDVLNPEDEPGRLTFIHRMGAAQIADHAALAAYGRALAASRERLSETCDQGAALARSAGNHAGQYVVTAGGLCWTCSLGCGLAQCPCHRHIQTGCLLV